MGPEPGGRHVRFQMDQVGLCIGGSAGGWVTGGGLQIGCGGCGSAWYRPPVGYHGALRRRIAARWLTVILLTEPLRLYAELSTLVTCGSSYTTRPPRLHSHLLIVPRHIPLMGVESLSAEHAPLLAHMGAVGRRLAVGATPQAGRPAPVGTDEVILGFHRWPLRSVPHLHLHALRRPFTPGWQTARYTEWSCACGAGFIDLASVVERLSSG